MISFMTVCISAWTKLNQGHEEEDEFPADKNFVSQDGEESQPQIADVYPMQSSSSSDDLKVPSASHFDSPTSDIESEHKKNHQNQTSKQQTLLTQVYIW